MSFYNVVNDKGIAAIKAWIEKTSAKNDNGLKMGIGPKSLEAWANDAELSMLAGNPPMVEMSHFYTISGRTETFTLSNDMISERCGEA